MSTVFQIHPTDLKEKLDTGEAGLLLDVREDWEHSLAAIPDSCHIPLGELVDRMQELMLEDRIVVYCHHGERSLRAARLLVESGFPEVFNLVGGIDAYSQIADPSVPRYRAAY